VYLYTYITGIPAGTSHAIHVHWYGDLSDDTGTAAGGHLNPYNQNHGLPPAIQRHMGDIGNITADTNGLIQAYGSYNLLNFQGVGNIFGHAVVLHAWGDDGNPLNTSASVGAAGPRWARCVIGVTSRQPPFLLGVSSTGGQLGGALSTSSVSMMTWMIASIVVVVARWFA